MDTDAQNSSWTWKEQDGRVSAQHRPQSVYIVIAQLGVCGDWELVSELTRFKET